MQAPTYDELAAVLSGYGDAITASECHGILCGMLSCKGELDSGVWAEQILREEMGPGDGKATGSVHVDAMDKSILQGLFDDTVRQLDDPELGFQLLMPDGDTSINERTEALASWCEGFLYGLSLAGIKGFSGFSEPVQEFSKDLVEISQLSHEEVDNEENESAFFDVTEYVRMGALMLRDEIVTASEDEHVAPSANDGSDVVLH